MKNVKKTKAIRLNKTTTSNYLTYLLVIVAFIVLNTMNESRMLSSTLRGQLIPICAYVVAALALNLCVGILGELSLGHAGFMSVGAFSGVTMAAILEKSVPDDSVRLLLAIVFGAVFAAAAGALVGIPVLRLNGDYLAIVTLAFGEIIKSLINNLYIGISDKGLRSSFVTNNIVFEKGTNGRFLINGPSGMVGINKIATFTAGFILIMVALVVIFHLVNSRSGRAIMALRDNRIAAESIGINITKYKMMAFVISAALAGAAGTLFALNQNMVPAQKFDFNQSILLLVFVVLGGQGRMWGSILAAAALTVLPELPAMRSVSEYRMLIYAVILIVVMLVTNNPTLKNFFTGLSAKFKKSEKGADAK